MAGWFGASKWVSFIYCCKWVRQRAAKKGVVNLFGKYVDGDGESRKTAVDCWPDFHPTSVLHTSARPPMGLCSDVACGSIVFSLTSHHCRSPFASLVLGQTSFFLSLSLSFSKSTEKAAAAAAIFSWFASKHLGSNCMHVKSGPSLEVFRSLAFFWTVAK